jgi:hypothetical protein
MTGGGFGPCGSGRQQGRTTARSRRRGVGFGSGFGWCRRQWAASPGGWRWPTGSDRRALPTRSPAIERDELQREVLALEQELTRLRTRLSELDDPTSTRSD